MKLRRTSAEVPDQAAIADTELAERPDRPVKGRPTPKRRDAAPRRQPVSAPKTRKETNEWRKQQTAQAKPNSVTGGPKMTSADLRAARMRGDESALTRRDKGPVRKYARDYVDTHRMAANFLLLLVPLYLVALRFPYLSAATAILLIVLLGECYFTARKIRRQAIAKFGETRETTLGLTFYVAGRAYLPRRMRVPKPRFKPGDSID